MSTRDPPTLGFLLQPCPLGWALAVASPLGLRALYLGDTRAALQALLHRDFPAAEPAPAAHPLQPLLSAALRELAPGKSPADLPLDLRGTPFQLAVWRSLQKIPAGETASYQHVAQSLGLPRAARAVAAACAANRVAVLVPCHRVLRSDGRVAGYRWGVERKRALLAAESTRARFP